MRLLWITNVVFGETMNQTTDIGACNSLAKEGWEITLVSPFSEKSNEFLDNIGYRWFGAKMSSIRGFQSFSLDRGIRDALRELLSRESFDAAVVNWSVCRGASKYLNRHGIPWILDDRSPPVHEDFLGRMQWFHYFLAWKNGSRNATAFSVITPALKDYREARFGQNEKIAIWPSAVSPGRFKKAKFPKNGPLRLVYHGLFDKERGVERIVELGDLITKGGHNIEILLFGRGNFFEELLVMSESRPWLNVLGQQQFDDVPELLSECHIGIIPLPDRFQWKFSSPLKMFEYAASGLTVIATDIHCHRSIGERRWLRLTNPDIFAEEGLKHFEEIMSERVWERNSEIARKEALDDFTWDKATESLNQLLKEIVDEKTGN